MATQFLDDRRSVQDVDFSSLSLNQARELETELFAAISKIDADLAAGKCMRPAPPDYWNWRARAIAAKGHKVCQFRLVKERIKVLNRDLVTSASATVIPQVDVHDPLSLLTAAHTVLRRLGKEYALTVEEKALIGALRDYIHTQRGGL